MRTITTRTLLYVWLATCCGVFPAGPQTVETHPSGQSRLAITHGLPAMRGSDLQITLVEVTYPPGGSSSTHTHPCPVVGYILKGSVRFRINDEKEVVYRAGDSFYEAPNSIHKVSANASQTQEATFLAYFVCDGKQELTKPIMPAK